MKALSTLGFEVARKHGSHVVMKHADGRVTVIPVHAKENITVGLLIKIMKDAKLRKGRIHKVTCGVLKYTPLLLRKSS